MEQSLNALNDEYRSLEKQDAEFQTAPEYTALMDAISEGRTQKRSLLDKPEALKQALDAYSAWQEESGYSDVIHRMEELRGEMKTLRGQLDSAKEQAAKEAKAATRAGYSETAYSIGRIRRSFDNRRGSSGKTGAQSGYEASSYAYDTANDSKSQAEKSPMQIALEKAQAKSKSKFRPGHGKQSG